MDCEEEFDEILDRIQAWGLPFWADPARRRLATRLRDPAACMPR